MKRKVLFIIMVMVSVITTKSYCQIQGLYGLGLNYTQTKTQLPISSIGGEFNIDALLYDYLLIHVKGSYGLVINEGNELGSTLRLVEGRLGFNMLGDNEMKLSPYIGFQYMLTSITNTNIQSQTENLTGFNIPIGIQWDIFIPTGYRGPELFLSPWGSYNIGLKNYKNGFSVGVAIKYGIPGRRGV